MTDDTGKQPDKNDPERATHGMYYFAVKLTPELNDSILAQIKTFMDAVTIPEGAIGSEKKEPTFAERRATALAALVGMFLRETTVYGAKCSPGCSGLCAGGEENYASIVRGIGSGLAEAFPDAHPAEFGQVTQQIAHHAITHAALVQQLRKLMADREAKNGGGKPKPPTGPSP